VFGQAKSFVALFRSPTATEIDGGVTIPFSATIPFCNRMRVFASRAFNFVAARLTANRLNFLDIEIAEDAVMVVAIPFGE
jgi:hypothetical protein